MPRFFLFRAGDSPTRASAMLPAILLIAGSLFLPFRIEVGASFLSHPGFHESLLSSAAALPEAMIPVAAALILVFASLSFPANKEASTWILVGGAAGAAIVSATIRGALPLTTVGSGAFLLFIVSVWISARGLSARGLIRGDTFVSASILFLGLFVLLFILIPNGCVLFKSFQRPDGTISLALPFETIRQYAPFWRVLRNSLLLAGTVGVAAPAIGLAFALVATRSRIPASRWFRAFSLLPIITPPFIISIAIILLFGLQGTVTSGFLGVHTRAIFGFPGLVLAQTLSFAPVAYLVLIGAVESIRPTLEEASLTLGASRWETFGRVTFPLLRPGLANAFLLTVIESLADFGNPMILGGDYEVLATETYFAIIGRYDQVLAANLGATLLFVTLAAFLLQQFWVGRRSYVTITGKPSQASFLPLPRGLEIGLLLFCFAWVLLTVVVYGSICVGGFVKLWGIDPSFTLDHYRRLLTDGLSALKTTLVLAAIAAPLTAVPSLLLAYLFVRHRFPGRRILEFCSMLSFAVPGTVVGIGYVMAFNQPPLLLTGTASILVLSFVFRNLPVGLRTGIAALHQVDPALEEASLTLRAGFGTTFRRIVVPLARSALISSLVFSFVRSITAISAVVFLVSPRWQVSTKVILDQAEAGQIGVATAYSTVLIVIMALVIALTYGLVGRFVRGVKWEGVHT
jgi:iron(III) transport system permease protein